MSWNLFRTRFGNVGDDQAKIVNVYWQSGANYAALYPPSRVYGNAHQCIKWLYCFSFWLFSNRELSWGDFTNCTIFPFLKDLYTPCSKVKSAKRCHTVCLKQGKKPIERALLHFIVFTFLVKISQVPWETTYTGHSWVSVGFVFGPHAWYFRILESTHGCRFWL